MSKTLPHNQKVWFWSLLALSLLITCSAAFAATVTFSPSSGLLTIKETDLARKMTLQFANYSSGEQLSITVAVPSDLVLLNQSSYAGFTGNNLELYLGPASTNYGTKQ